MTGPMRDDEVRELLHEVAAGVEPGDRLDAIRAATSARRGGRGWWVAGGVGLVAASVVTALALTTGGTPRTTAPEPAEPSPTPTTVATDRVTRGEGLEVWIYFVGETPDGQRLYRERRHTSGDNPFAAAEDGLRLAPMDPDYTSLWPADAIQRVSFDGIADDGVIGVTVDPTYQRRPVGMSEAEAQLALEQVIRTFQAATKSRAAMQFYVGDNPSDQVLGVPTSEPVTTRPDLDVLAHVSLSDPFEGQVVDNDEPFVVRGAANSFEGNVVTRIQRWEGTEVVAEEPTIAGWNEDRLFPFEVTFDLTDVPPGDYVVISRTDDPSGAGMFDTDTRRITVID